MRWESQLQVEVPSGDEPRWHQCFVLKELLADQEELYWHIFKYTCTINHTRVAKGIIAIDH